MGTLFPVCGVGKKISGRFARRARNPAAKAAAAAPSPRPNGERVGVRGSLRTAIIGHLTPAFSSFKGGAGENLSKI